MAVIKTIPTFMNIVQISLLKSDQFSLFWEGIATNKQTGASPILSYSLEWSTDNVVWDIL